MQQIDRIDVLTAQLAETDRRALSQAWYSALHLAETAPRGSHRIAVGRCLPGAAAAAARQATSRGTPLRATTAVDRATATARESARRRGPAAPGLERRAPKTVLARRLERALIRRVPRAAVTSFALRAGTGRIRLLVRSDGSRTRVVAVCPLSLRDRVERALAQARFALAGRGVAAEVA
jgi:hypothetical protein